MKKTFNIVGNRKYFFLGIAAVLAVCLLLNLILGTALDVEFKGGTLLKYSYVDTESTTVTSAQVDDLATSVLGDGVSASLTSSGSEKVVNIEFAQEITMEKQAELEEKLVEAYPDNEFTVIDASSINPTMGNWFFIKCLVAVGLSALFLLIYIGLRFRKIGGFSAGVMAVIALLIDCLIAYFTFVIFRIPLDGNFVAVVLTILGYSLNSSIVIFDRVRENRRTLGDKVPVAELVNTSINQSFTRSFYTSLSTFIAIGSISVLALITNMDAIFSFALPMMFGILSGFYTSTFLCGPMWVVWMEHKQKKAPAKKK